MQIRFSKMNVDIEITRSALQFVCGDNEHICRLCLSSTAKKEFSFDDTISLKKSYHDENITFNDILLELGVPVETYLPQVLCKDCTNILVHSYLFQKLCQFSNQKWSEALAKLETGLNEADTVNPTTQSLYLVVNDAENIIFTSRKSYSVKNKKNALLKIKSIVKSREYYMKYTKKHRETQPFQGTDLLCGKCGLNFESSHLFSKHMRSHNGRHACPKCAKVFTTQKQVAEHSERVHKPRNIQCPKCGKMFSTKKILHFHDQMHHVAAICKLCFVQFPSKYVLRAHLDKHEVNKCPKCKKSYLNKNTYKFHLKICGKDSEKQPTFFCDICGKGYVRKNGIRTHLKVEHGFGHVLSCTWCNKKFDAISRLKNHIVKHTKERNFRCTLCNGKFVTQAALVYHKRLHTGEKPFPCDLCNESFLSASRRMEHKHRKHFKPTKECHICHIKFVMGHQLKKHVQRHYNPQSKLYVPNAIVPQEYNLMETVLD